MQGQGLEQSITRKDSLMMIKLIPLQAHTWKFTPSRMTMPDGQGKYLFKSEFLTHDDWFQNHHQ
jgi:hypothetical protein